jgi:hypothetical protein
MMEKIWKKGQFIINPKAPGWGVGILTEDQRGDGVVKFSLNTNAG